MPRVRNVILGARKNPALSPMKMNDPIQRILKEVQDVFYSHHLAFDERKALLSRMANSYKAMDDDPQFKFLFKSITSTLQKAEQEDKHEKMRLDALAAHARYKTEKHMQLCIDYALLDSLPQIHVSEEGVSEEVSQQFYLSLLEQFDAIQPCVEVKHLIQALQKMNVLLACCDDFSQPLGNADKLFFPFHSYKRHLFAQLKALELKQCPYVLLSVSTVDHAMAAKIEFVDGEGYVLTLVNTGHGAVLYSQDKTCEMIYPDLTHEEIFLIGTRFFKRNKTIIDFYAGLAAALPPEKRDYYPGRDFKQQLGDSCACQRLSVLIHGILPKEIYWAFKTFATEKMIPNIPQGPRLEAAQSLLLKRQQKISLQSAS